MLLATVLIKQRGVRNLGHGRRAGRNEITRKKCDRPTWVAKAGERYASAGDTVNACNSEHFRREHSEGHQNSNAL